MAYVNCNALNCDGLSGTYAHGSYGPAGYALPSYARQHVPLDGCGSLGAVVIDCARTHDIVIKAIEDAVDALDLDWITAGTAKTAAKTLSGAVTDKLWGYAQTGYATFKTRALDALPSGIRAIGESFLTPLLDKAFASLSDAVQRCGTLTEAPEYAPPVIEQQAAPPMISPFLTSVLPPRMQMATTPYAAAVVPGVLPGIPAAPGVQPPAPPAVEPSTGLMIPLVAAAAVALLILR